MEGAPNSIRNAGDTLDIFAEWAIRGDADLLHRDRIEFVSNWPEIVLQEPNATKRFVAAGKLAEHWQENGHRKSTTINGSALVDCLRSLFSGEKQ